MSHYIGLVLLYIYVLPGLGVLTSCQKYMVGQSHLVREMNIAKTAGPYVAQ